MKEPIKPNSEDCCSSGCNPCIFDVYEKQLKLYKKYKESGDKSYESNVNSISQMEYTVFTVIESSKICDSIKKIKFRKSVADNSKPKVFWNPGAHFLLKFQSEEYACTRAYTPIKLRMSCNEDCDFTIVVKKYAGGIVSSFLYNLIDGQQTLWRGPFGSYNMMLNVYTKIIMIAQGTGIAPLISIIDNIVDSDEDNTKIILFYCCSALESIIFREELYALKSFWNFEYIIYVSNCIDVSRLKYEEPIIQRKLTFEDIFSRKPFDNDQFLVCGSTKFMNEFKTCLLEVGISKESIVLF